MTLNNFSSDNTLFSSVSKNYNYTESEVDELKDLIKSLNIIDPESLSTQQLTNIYKKIDDYNGLFTTQQLDNIDFSEFKNHVHFDSAVNKVSFTFDRVQNIPYDKDILENIKYSNENDGYTNYIIKNIYPKSKGYAKFSGQEMIVVYDEQGKLLSDVKTRKIGLLNPENKRFSFDFWLKVDTNNFVNNQMVFNKVNITSVDSQNVIDNGYLCFITEDVSDVSMCYLNFVVYVNKQWVSSSFKIKKDVFQHIAINVYNSNNNKKIDFICNGNIVESSNILSTGNIQAKSFNDSFKNKDIPFVIGNTFIITESGVLNTIRHNGQQFAGFIGSIDEFRLFYKTRSYKAIKKDMHRNINAQKFLQLYLRFNEPAGNYTNSFLNIDYSGNKLHGIYYQINSGIQIIQDTTNYKINSDTPLRLERLEDSPVLNSSYTEISNIRERLVDIARLFDNDNPNIIFKLLPKHYFLDSADFQSLSVFSSTDAYTTSPEILIDENVNITKKSSLKAIIPANNDLVNIVLIWAKFFDQLKLYISSITNMLNVDYDSINSEKIIGMQIPILCKMYGIKFKEILPTITKNKLNSENLVFEDLVSEFSIRKIQNILWQRFLINTQDFLRSKGTIKSLESAFNAFGIDYRKLIDIKEYASNNIIEQKNNFSFQSFKRNYLNFGNTFDLNTTATFDDNTTNSFSNNKLNLEISNIKHRTSTQNNYDESLQHGLGKNWSIELYFGFNDLINEKKFLNLSKINQVNNVSESFNNIQNLFRVDQNNINILNVKYQRNNSYYSKLGSLIIEIKTHNNSNNNKTLVINNVDVFNFNKYLCVSQSIDNNSNVTVQATIKDIGSQIQTKDKKIDKKTFNIQNLNDNDLLFNKENLSLRIGEYNYTGTNDFIDQNSILTFEGNLYAIKLWKKFLSDFEINSHSNHINNIGVDNLKPYESLISFFPVTNIQSQFNSGTSIRSWAFSDESQFKQKSMIDTNSDSVLDKEIYTSINSCIAKSKNTNHSDLNCILFNDVFMKIKSTKLDTPNKSNKVNIVSYEKAEHRILTENNNLFPAHKTPVNYKHDIINKVSVDMSITKVVDDDINNLICDVEEFTKIISNSQSMYYYQYQALDDFRQRYFKKYDDKNNINYNSLGSVFKYFDNIMSSILYDIVPSKVRFDGFNFVYESHVLERHKYEHKNKNSINSIVESDSVNFSRKLNKARRSRNYNINRRN
jgi:hypothetical protein